ncbi:MAG: Na(+)/H(+) antiporter subunit B [Bacteroidota bacterium]
MNRKTLIALLIAAMAVVLFPLYESYQGSEALSEVGQYYADNGVEDTGAQNLVTSVVVTYRGLDTLGEVTILFLAASIISFFLSFSKEERIENRQVRSITEILTTSAQILVPMIYMFGVYIFVNGHLTPGGGFQGGAVIASGTLLMFLSNPNFKLNHKIIHFVESTSGLVFVLIGVVGAMMMDGGFLSNKIAGYGFGQVGSILSAGAIPVIYTFLGLKVGTELSNVLGIYVESQNEK